MDPLTVITTSDLIQANVTVIAGILVLLTVSITLNKENASVFGYMAFAPLPFVLSVACLVFNTFMGWNIENITLFAVTAFVFGLGYMSWTVIKVVVAITRS
ncbi:membrane hypothetical protein [metagenome]